METSVEIRWFWDAEPAALRAWFADVDVHGCAAGGGGKERVDEYLDDPKQDELGIKVRGGTSGGIDVKGLVAVRHGVLVTGPFAGPVEIWSKWRSRFEIDPKARVKVAKLRWLRKWDGAKARPVEVPLGPDEKPAVAGTPLPALGCNVELTRLALGSRTAWTFGFEAFGPSSTLEESLRATVAEIERRDPPVGMARPASYPKWLRDHR